MSTLKRGYHHGDLPASVLQSAAQLLEKKGLEGLTMRALARRAKVSHNAPYRHFPDRESLLAALAADGYAMLGKAQREAAAADGLRGMGEAYVRFALEHPQRFRLMFGGAVQIARHPVLREIATKTFEALSGALASRVAAAQGARDASIAAWALVHGLAHLLLEGRVAQAARAGRSEEQFVREVLATVRFAAGAAQSA
jgi:AcrR family transcriptional regulator